VLELVRIIIIIIIIIAIIIAIIIIIMAISFDLIKDHICNTHHWPIAYLPNYHIFAFIKKGLQCIIESVKIEIL